MSDGDEMIDNGYTRWVTGVVEKAMRAKVMSGEDGLRSYLISEVRSAMFNSDALWAADVDKLAEIAVDVFTDFARKLASVPSVVQEKPR